MNRLFKILLLFQLALYAQQDFSNDWKDFYSFNSISDFIIQDNTLYASSERGFFTYDLDNNSLKKFTSINGLSADNITTIYRSEGKTILGFETGLLQIVDDKGRVSSNAGLKLFTNSINKRINKIVSFDNQFYLLSSLGISLFDLSKNEIIETYLSDTGSSFIDILDMVVIDEGDNQIAYVGANDGLYSLNFTNPTKNPRDINNWIKISSKTTKSLEIVKGEVLAAQSDEVYRISNNQLTLVTIEESNIEDLSVSLDEELILSFEDKVVVYNVDVNNNQLDLSLNTQIDIADLGVESNVIKSDFVNSQLYIATSSGGIIQALNANNYELISPVGLSNNSPFSVKHKGNNLLVSYGAYTEFISVTRNEKPIDYFYNGRWYSIPFKEHNALDIVATAIHPNEETIFLGSFFNGLLEFKYNSDADTWEKTNVYTSSNTDGKIAPHVTLPGLTFISDLYVDKNNIMWISNNSALDLQLMSAYNLNENKFEGLVSFKNSSGIEGGRIRGIKISSDDAGNVYTATKDNKVIVFDSKNKARKDFIKKEISAEFTRCAVVDQEGKLWVGTRNGLEVIDNLDFLYTNKSRQSASPIIIEDESGIAQRFLGELEIREIIVDNSNNKWFATFGGGLFYANSTGEQTLLNFNTSNSPLPSNNIIDIELDNETGQIYIATDKGLLRYTSVFSPFADSISDVVAYPNPAISGQTGHDTVTIEAKNGAGLPENTNIKIMDVSGKLVYETNLISSQQLYGGKAIWDKRNLGGTKVASGVYIILVSSPDGTENTTTKVAIIN